MQVMKVVCRKFRSTFLFIAAFVRKIFCCWRRRKRSEDSSLPHSVVVERSPTHGGYPEWTGAGDVDQWGSWKQKPFSNVVEEKIEEYRRKKTESLEQPEEVAEPDFFNDMQPEVKRTRKAFVGGTEQRLAKGNLFAFNASDVPPVVPSGELGLLEEYSDGEGEKWDDSIDIKDVDDVLREQRMKERRERQMQRRLEHEKRLKEKRVGVHS